MSYQSGVFNHIVGLQREDIIWIQKTFMGCLWHG